MGDEGETRKQGTIVLVLAALAATSVAYGHARPPHIYRGSHTTRLHQGQHSKKQFTQDQEDDAVWSAAFDGNVDQLQQALAHGGRVNQTNDMMQTPLLDAVKGGHAAVVRILIAHSADANVGDAVYTPLDDAKDGEDGVIGKVGIKVGSTKRNMDPVLRTKYAEIVAMLKKAGEKE